LPEVEREAEPEEESPPSPPERREEKKRRARARMPKHGAGLRRVYRDAVLKRAGKKRSPEAKG